MLYILLFMLMIVAGVCIKDKEKDKKAFIFFWSILTLMLLFRYGQGSDYFNYDLVYRSIGGLDTLRNASDIGFNALVFIFKFFGFKYEMFSAFIALISMIFVYMGINKLSKNKVLSLATFYSLYYMVYLISGIRQGLVLSIFLGVLIPLLINKKNIFYIIGVIVAATIHMSALVLLPLVIVNFIDFSKVKTVIILLITSLVFKVFGIQSLLISILPEAISKRVSYYLNGDISLFAIANRVLFFVIIYYLFMKATDDEKNQNKISMSIYNIGLILYILLMDSPLMASRLTAYMKVAEVILIGNLILLQKVNLKVIIRYSAVTLLVYVMLIKNISAALYQGNYYGDVTVMNYPYISILNKEDIFGYKTMNDRSYISIFSGKYQYEVREPEWFEKLPDLNDIDW